VSAWQTRDVPKPLIRPIAERDVDTVVQFVHDLAAYENAASECQLTTEQLRTALFGAVPALFGHVAEADGRVIGFVLWFLNFSTWTGTHGIYAEDMYVLPEYRGSGAGTLLFRAMGEECRRRGYTRLQWWTLKWNEPTIAFVTGLGAKPMDEWTVYRIDGQALVELADREPGAGPATSR
jgi:GNAT superfamily N-acetyltransferase